MESVSINEALIVAVQKRPPLYDKRDDRYSNRIYITKQWKDIAEEIGIDGKIIVFIFTAANN